MASNSSRWPTHGDRALAPLSDDSALGLVTPRTKAQMGSHANLISAVFTPWARQRRLSGINHRNIFCFARSMT